MSASAIPPLPRVLVADASLPNRRLIRELLTAFRLCEVDDASTAEHAYERVLEREYILFVFAFTLPDMSGPLLDRMIAKIYTRCHPQAQTAPPVVFLTRSEDSAAFHAIHRNARVRGAVPLPLSLDALMTATGSILPKK